VAGYIFGNTPFVRDHLSAIVLFGISVALVPMALGGVWKLGRRLVKR
jgi:membrane-associated protein